VTGHPLDEYEEKIRDLATHDSATLEGLEKGVEVALCGILTGVQKKRNKEQRLWTSMLIEDRAGSVEGLCFATAFERLANMVVEDKPVLV
jgi:DNA polymerase-3 subunit alpha